MRYGHVGWWLWLTVDALAVFRIWRLAARDTITEWFRKRVKRNVKFTDWLTCPWCLGAWATAGAIALTVYLPRYWWYAAIGLAVSGAVGILGEHVG